MSDAYRPPQEDAETAGDSSAEIERGRMLVLVVIGLSMADALYQAAVAGRVLRAAAIAGLSLALYYGHFGRGCYSSRDSRSAVATRFGRFRFEPPAGLSGACTPPSE